MAATTPKRPFPPPRRAPEQVCLLLRCDAAQLAVCGDQVHRADVVGGVAELAAQHGHPAAEVVRDGPDPGRGPVEGSEAVFGRRADEVAGAHPGPEACRAGDRVDVDRAHPRGADEDGPVGGYGRSVAGGLHSHRESVLGGVPDGGQDVVRVGGAEDHRRVVLYRQVVPAAFGVVAVITGVQDRARRGVGRRSGHSELLESSSS